MVFFEIKYGSNALNINVEPIDSEFICLRRLKNHILGYMSRLSYGDFKIYLYEKKKFYQLDDEDDVEPDDRLFMLLNGQDLNTLELNTSSCDVSSSDDDSDSGEDSDSEDDFSEDQNNSEDIQI